MTIKFLSKHRATNECEHESRTRIEVAGMSRETCEACGKVSVGYVEDHLSPERAQKVEAAVRAFGTNAES